MKNEEWRIKNEEFGELRIKNEELRIGSRGIRFAIGVAGGGIICGGGDK